MENLATKKENKPRYSYYETLVVNGHNFMGI